MNRLMVTELPSRNLFHYQNTNTHTHHTNTHTSRREYVHTHMIIFSYMIQYTEIKINVEVTWTCFCAQGIAVMQFFDIRLIALLILFPLCLEGSSGKINSSGWQVAIERPAVGETLMAGGMSTVVFYVWQSNGCDESEGMLGARCRAVECSAHVLSLQIHIDGEQQWTKSFNKESYAEGKHAVACSKHTGEIWTSPGAHTIKVLLLGAPDNKGTSHGYSARERNGDDAGVAFSQSLLATHLVSVWAQTLPWPELKIHRC